MKIMNHLSLRFKRIALAFFLFIIFLHLLPSLFLQTGYIFFGGNTLLYNIKFAEFFITYSAYPLVGKSAPYAHYQLSRIYFIKGNNTLALKEAQKELEIYPDHINTYYILGLTLGYMHREKEAIDAFSKFIEYKPESWAARNDKAWLQFRIGDIDGALATIEPVVKQYRKTVWVQNTYCALLISKKKYTEAKEACTYAKEAADKMTPDSWGRSYPGNDPRIYESGLEATRKSISENIKLIDEALTP